MIPWIKTFICKNGSYQYDRQEQVILTRFHEKTIWEVREQNLFCSLTICLIKTPSKICLLINNEVKFIMEREVNSSFIYEHLTLKVVETSKNQYCADCVFKNFECYEPDISDWIGQCGSYERADKKDVHFIAIG